MSLLKDLENQPEPKLELRPTRKDVVIYDCQKQSDEDLMAAVLNSHSVPRPAQEVEVLGGTK